MLACIGLANIKHVLRTSLELLRPKLLICHIQFKKQHGVWLIVQESRAAARKPRDAASVLFR